MPTITAEKKPSFFSRTAVDYRRLRLHNLTSTEFRHLLLLLYWPLYGLLFMYVEKFYPVEEVAKSLIADYEDKRRKDNIYYIKEVLK